MTIPRRRETGAPDSDAVWTVTALARAMRGLMESHFGGVWISGEISNFKKYGSGHCYFTLKDDKAQLPAVLFRGAAPGMGTNLRDGLAVLVFGEVTVYEAQGKCQVVVRRIVPHGAGALQARFEALKKKLGDEGLFDEARKRPLPLFPERVAVITSPSGAAIRDMLSVLGRRAPQVEVRIFPVRVQGDAAPGEITAALETLGRWYRRGLFRPDVVIVARGGGSLEDLWAFNEETVARAIAACPVPTISGVGHEIDFTIADFVVDLRAPTPSAAAELLVADRKDFRISVQRAWERCDRTIRRVVQDWRVGIERLARSPSFREPIRVVRTLEQRTDGLVERLGRALGGAFNGKRQMFLATSAGFANRAPGRMIPLLDSRLSGLAGRLELLNPVRTIARGFAVLLDGDGNILRSVKGVSRGDAIVARLSDGILKARIEGVEQGG